MINLGKFHIYQPDSTFEIDDLQAKGVLFFQNDDGTDWYDLKDLTGFFVLVDDDNRVVSVSEDITALSPVGMAVIQLEEDAPRPELGWVFDGTAFSEPDPKPEPLKPITARQLRLVLFEAGYLDQIEPALEAIPDDTVRKAALIEWEYATEYLPDNPLVTRMVAALGLADDELEALWRQAEVT